jgi:glycosyltransferase involved in cell wall biosynthesis
MKYVVIIPAHNEAKLLPGLLESLYSQSLPPQEIILVNDQSSDETEAIMQVAANQNTNTAYLNHRSSSDHLPGAKVVNAFNYGLNVIKGDYDFVVKLDADLILPIDYFTLIAQAFENPQTGVAGGFCYEQNEQGEWKKNHPMHQDHVRGAFKAYRKSCFKAMGGLRSAMGWDTVDELLARYHGFSVKTLEDLHVRHLRPVGSQYKASAAQRQGKAFYQMRYGGRLSLLASLKSIVKKRSVLWGAGLFLGYLKALFSAIPFMVTRDEGQFIRAYRWEQLKNR